MATGPHQGGTESKDDGLTKDGPRKQQNQMVYSTLNLCQTDMRAGINASLTVMNINY